MKKGQRRIALALAGVAIILAMVALSFEGLFRIVDEKEIVGIQLPFGSGITWHTEPGLKLRLFGKMIRYDKEFIFRIKNMDAGQVKIVASTYVNMPCDEANLNKLAHQLGSQYLIQLKLLQPAFDRVIFRSGLLVASIKSDADRREQLKFFIEDQAAIGIYRTTARKEAIYDPATGEEKNVVIVEVISDPENPNNYLRAEISPLLDYGLKIHDLVIHELVLDKRKSTYFGNLKGY
ncbi:MAG: hypothetical protein WAV73_06330 [Candidatus Moraniibacteriota bacterium]